MPSIPDTITRPGLWRSFCIQCSTIQALMIQSIVQHQRKSKLGYLWEIFDPMMQIGVWFALFTVVFHRDRHIYDMNVFLFLSTGIISVFFFQKVAGETQRARKSRLKYLNIPRVSVFDFIAASALLEVVLMILVAIILWGIIVYGGFGFAPADPLGVIGGVGCLAFLGCGFGVYNAGVISWLPVHQKFCPVYQRILFLTSGAIFPVDRMPPDILNILKWNPVYQGVDLVRSAWSYTHEPEYSSNSYVLLWGAFLLLIGSVLIKKQTNYL